MESMGKKPRRRRSFTPEFKAEIASLDAIGAALARHGTPLADDIVILHEGKRAALVSGPEGHRFLAEEAAAG
jgi:hypothetical protein